MLHFRCHQALQDKEEELLTLRATFAFFFLFEKNLIFLGKKKALQDKEEELLTLRETFARTLHQMEAKHCYEMQVCVLTKLN